MTFLLVIRKNKDGAYNRWLVRRSPYKALEPYIFAQAKHETANFTSNVYNKHLNMFGMKNALKRNQLGTPGPLYRNFIYDGQSIKDLLLYFDYVRFPKRVINVDTYAKELKDRSYYEDSIYNYTNGLKRFL